MRVTLRMSCVGVRVCFTFYVFCRSTRTYS